jgi:hypothetical protein
MGLATGGTLRMGVDSLGRIKINDNLTLRHDGSNCYISNSTGTVLFATGTTTMGFSATALYPNTSLSMNLGVSNAYWGNLYINLIVQDSLNNKCEKSSLADNGTITLATGVAGWGYAQIGDRQEWMRFGFKVDGTVDIEAGSINAVNTDTDEKFCVYDAGSGVVIKNALGSRLTCAVDIHYYTP